MLRSARSLSTISVDFSLQIFGCRQRIHEFACWTICLNNNFPPPSVSSIVALVSPAAEEINLATAAADAEEGREEREKGIRQRNVSRGPFVVVGREKQPPLPPSLPIYFEAARSTIKPVDHRPFDHRRETSGNHEAKLTGTNTAAERKSGGGNGLPLVTHTHPPQHNLHFTICGQRYGVTQHFEDILCYGK